MADKNARAALVARLQHSFQRFRPRVPCDHRTVAEIDELVRLRKAGL